MEIDKSEVAKVDVQTEKTNLIGIEDFSKVELKVGKILEQHIVEGADKLYRFLVDVGEKDTEGNSTPRTILSGIREFFPEENMFIGKYVCVVANLAPRKLRGYESNGMLLFAGGNTGKVFTVSPENFEGTMPEPGTIIR